MCFRFATVFSLLMLPVFFYPPDTIKRVLVLGVGGGAVFHSLRYFINPELMVGVELDDVHLKIARRFFDLKGQGIELHTADAMHWMQHYTGAKFDLIIDDVFAEQDRQPLQVTTATQQWLAMKWPTLLRVTELSGYPAKCSLLPAASPLDLF